MVVVYTTSVSESSSKKDANVAQRPDATKGGLIRLHVFSMISLLTMLVVDQWSVNDVALWAEVVKIPADEVIILRNQQIDGRALLDDAFTLENLVNLYKMPGGPASIIMAARKNLISGTL